MQFRRNVEDLWPSQWGLANDKFTQRTEMEAAWGTSGHVWPSRYCEQNPNTFKGRSRLKLAGIILCKFCSNLKHLKQQGHLDWPKKRESAHLPPTKEGSCPSLCPSCERQVLQWTEMEAACGRGGTCFTFSIPAFLCQHRIKTYNFQGNPLCKEIRHFQDSSCH